jgi:hypothetical protein
MRTDGGDFVEFLALDLRPQNRAALEARLRAWFGDAAEILLLLDLLLNGDVDAAKRISAAGTDALYLAALVDLVRRCPLREGIAVAGPAQRIHFIDVDYDFFHDLRDENEWSLLRCLNFLYRAKICPTKRIALVTSIRDEGINLLEWIAHHRLLGIDDFIIYANDITDGSADLLNMLAVQEVIQLVWNTTALADVGPTVFPVQAKAFFHACEFLRESRDYEFLYFADPDEFLVTRPMLEHPDMLRPLDDLWGRIGGAAAVAFSWKWFGSHCAYRRGPGLNFQRFRHAVHADKVKTIARTNRCLSFSTSHMPRLPHGDVVLDGSLNPVAAPGFQMPASYGYGQVNHYWNKSFEEFICKNARVGGRLPVESFFDYGDNRRLGAPENVPAVWLERLTAEIMFLKALPGVAGELPKIEAAFRQTIAAFDRQHDREKLFYKHFVREV